MFLHPYALRTILKSYKTIKETIKGILSIPLFLFSFYSFLQQ